ncbi:MAG TPA: hypothetical protein VEA59_02910 [Patescibacteria group bacterium]|nr:hypothetical protein [Patescibacteria group bacterium]
MKIAIEGAVARFRCPICEKDATITFLNETQAAKFARGKWSRIEESQSLHDMHNIIQQLIETVAKINNSMPLIKQQIEVLRSQGKTETASDIESQIQTLQTHTLHLNAAINRLLA